VPLSLDGISITFGFWAFVAVKRGRHPGRSERIVYVGALISAWINYNHGRQEWTGAAGVYLGFLSLASAWMFHELLSQFMDAQEARPRARRTGTPMFGERWLWAPWSTLMARRIWVVYPPTPDVEPTAANAIAHREQIREFRDTKRLRRRATATRFAQPASASIVRHSEHSPATTHRHHDAAPVPAHLIAPGRFAAINHQQIHGRPISADELSAAINITPDVARHLLATLAETAPTTVAPVLNGTPIGGVR